MITPRGTVAWLTLLAPVLVACATETAPPMETRTFPFLDGPRALTFAMPEEAWSRRPLGEFLATLPALSSPEVIPVARRARLAFRDAFEASLGDPADPAFAARMEAGWARLAEKSHPDATLQGLYDRFIGLEMLRQALHGAES